jgi:thymidylate synthase
MFWPERDANPFFHLYEALWMLAGRNDVAGPARYSSNMNNFSDDGKTLHGAYGYRWRKAFKARSAQGASAYEFRKPFDQLAIIAQQLTHDPTDRRCVLQMWSAELDLGRQGKDLPCNDTATFQIGPDGRLHLVVFCRSNDIVWGAYGANAVHFSMLLEYMALWIGVPVGTYTQISVNWHGYLTTLEKVKDLRHKPADHGDYYTTMDAVKPLLFPVKLFQPTLFGYDHVEAVRQLLESADMGNYREYDEPWAKTIMQMFMAHRLHKDGETRDAIEMLERSSTNHYDWTCAGIEWLERRWMR